MQHARPLPPFLVGRYHEWQARMKSTERERLADLAEHGQRPRAMIVACCDSRVMATDVFGGEAGDFFVHRNIANLVPRSRPDGTERGTSATVEYAVTVLNIDHLIVMGHYGCGGVAGCYDMHAGTPGAPGPETYVGRWLTVLSPGYARVAGLRLDREAALRALERQAVILSLENLMSFPFVAQRVATRKLELHGVWKDIADGALEYYDAASRSFQPV
ncbi:carbonic anhydrase [Amaricoccus sp.]|uniref:carbonic anhydrase n=1 Tax=Amaricoccus sp. TaxID=1872485 RepID=UPI001B72CD35|nr:carbonic anhydrase [Amaricoccus sp.]MBP7002919.1 carbonic anhydrase [Amaricoccus sp.]